MKRVAWNRGTKASEEARAKMRAHVFTAEHRRKLSESHLGQVPPNAWETGHEPWNKGRAWSEENRQKLSAAHKGKPSNRKGCRLSAETRAKISAAFAGERSARWQGGIGRERYALGFTKRLKMDIRERDGFSCMACGKPEGDRPHVVHHVDYKKTNHGRNNLVTLCPSCHSKTNLNREEWIIYFTQQKETA